MEITERAEVSQRGSTHCGMRCNQLRPGLYHLSASCPPHLEPADQQASETCTLRHLRHGTDHLLLRPHAYVLRDKAILL
jgi:hypothetical protein